MQIQVYRLREAMELLGPVIPRKPNYAPLNCFLVKDGRAAATDLEITITAELPEAEGQCLFPYRQVADLLKRVRGHDVLTIEQEDKTLSLAWSDGKATFETQKPDDYPPVPEVEAVVEHRVDGNSLVPALLSVADYCSTEESRPVLTGVFLGFGETTDVVAADGFRIAWQSLPLTFPDGIDSVIIPARAVRLLGQLLNKAPRTPPVTDSLIGLITAKMEMELKVNEKMLQAQLGAVSLITNLIEGTYPNYRQLIPTEMTARVGVMAPELERAVRQVSMVARDGKGAVRLTWSDSTMTVSAASDDMGRIETAIPVHTESNPGRIAINVNYLLRYLQGKDGLVTIELSGEQSPARFRYSGSPLVVIMPMFVQWESDGAPAEAETDSEDVEEE
jgi:DNA polymerase-3 subunit beta